MKKKIKNFLERIENFIRSKNKEINLYSKEQVNIGLLTKAGFWKVYCIEHQKSFEIYLPNYNEHRKFLYENILELIEFIIIDEFTHPELFKDVSFMNGKQYAKLIYDEKGCM